MKKILLTLILILVACSTRTQAVTYKCTNPENKTESTIITARFYNGGVKISVNGTKEETLTQSVTASGARYTNEHGTEFWTKGKTAILTTFGASIDCVED
jgi:membrane-bound inhibitor of C-type lysozyme